jgi:hypothetical protein
MDAVASMWSSTALQTRALPSHSLGRAPACCMVLMSSCSRQPTSAVPPSAVLEGGPALSPHCSTHATCRLSYRPGCFTHHEMGGR